MYNYLASYDTYDQFGEVSLTGCEFSFQNSHLIRSSDDFEKFRQALIQNALDLDEINSNGFVMINDVTTSSTKFSSCDFFYFFSYKIIDRPHDDVKKGYSVFNRQTPFTDISEATDHLITTLLHDGILESDGKLTLIKFRRLA